MPITKKKVSPEELAQMKAEAESAKFQPSPEVLAEIERLKPIYNEAVKDLHVAKLVEMGAFPGPPQYQMTPGPATITLPSKPPENPTQALFTGDPIMDNYASRSVKLWDGRVVEMAPPDIIHQIIVPAMFAGSKEPAPDESKRIAIVMQYVRSIGERKLPGHCQSWQEVMSLTRELGQLGYNAVQEMWFMTWPDLGGLYWEELKKNLPGY
jgi:hypothetical protein